MSEFLETEVLLITQLDQQTLFGAEPGQGLIQLIMQLRGGSQGFGGFGGVGGWKGL